MAAELVALLNSCDDGLDRPTNCEAVVPEPDLAVALPAELLRLVHEVVGAEPSADLARRRHLKL